MADRRKLVLATVAALVVGGGLLAAFIFGAAGNARENSAFPLATPTASATSGTSTAPVPTPGSASASPTTSDAPTSTPPATDSPGNPPAGPEAAPPPPADPAEAAAPPQPVSPPIALSATATVSQGILAHIRDIEAVQGEAKGIGEVAGPAVRFRVTVENATDKAVSTDQVVVNVSAGNEETPAIPLSGPGVELFPATIDPGTTASAVYVYLIPNDQRQLVRIYFTFRIDVPVASFEGPVPQTGSTP